MSALRFPPALLVPALALAAWGGGGKSVDTATYSCGQFNKSLQTKGDNSSGNYINQLRKQAKLGQPTRTEREEITIGIIFACRGKASSTRPATQAIATAKKIAGGKFKLPPGPKSKKKSNQ